MRKLCQQTQCHIGHLAAKKKKKKQSSGGSELQSHAFKYKFLFCFLCPYPIHKLEKKR